MDPLVDATGQAYAYTGGDPVNAVDPLGTRAGHLGPGVACQGSKNMAECEATIRSEVLGVPCSDFETASQSGPEALGLALLIGTGGIGDLVEALGATGDAEVSDLLASGAEADPADAGGQLTRAGRAYAKAGEVFGTTSGGPAAINEAGQDALNEILSNPGTEVESVTTGRFEGGLRFVAPDGTFVVFDQEGTLQYFARTKP